ncbi:MAG: hypothetical protein HZB46_13300 [Solirubrobacterales bacterium]|nr:hypothetical protein [Solirubrobacterales bacterium]
MRDAALILLTAGIAGLAAVPFAAALFAPLADRGVAFARPIALLAVAFVAFWLKWLGVTPTRGLAIALFLVLVVAGAWAWWRPAGRALLRDRVVLRSLVVSEALFVVTCVGALGVRAYMPDVVANEKMFDMAVWTSLMRDGGLPPMDPWASGLDLNYYYFGHFVAMITSLPSGAAPWFAYNAATALWAGLFASSAYAVSAGIAGALLGGGGPMAETPSAAPAGKPAPSGGRFARGADAVRLVPPHRRDRFVREGTTATLERPPASEPAGAAAAGTAPAPRVWPVVVAGLMGAVLVAFVGNLQSTLDWLRHDGPIAQFKWFEVSRVVPGTINEFPLFSLVLGDLHAHMLIVPFFLLAVGVALRIALGGARWAVGLAAAACLAAMHATSTWSLPITACLFAGAGLAAAHGPLRSRLLQAAAWGVGPLVAGYLIALPFVLSFDAPVDGIGRVTDHPGLRQWFTDQLHTQAIGLWVVLGATAWRLWTARESRAHDLRWLAAGAVAVLPGWLLAGPAALLLVPAAVALGVAFDAHSGAAVRFCGLVGAAGVVSLLLPEAVYVRDYFAGSINYRTNTVFKFTYHAWLLLAVLGGALFAVALVRRAAPAPSRARRSAPLAWATGLAALAVVCLPFLVVGPQARTADFSRPDPTLNGIAWLLAGAPGDVDAIGWLRAHTGTSRPVVLEAPGPEYSPLPYGRISAYTGLPTPYMGPEHELVQSRRLPKRATEIDEIFTASSLSRTTQLLRRYRVAYVVIGASERLRFGEPNLAKWRGVAGEPVFSSRGTVIYRTGP